MTNAAVVTKFNVISTEIVKFRNDTVNTNYVDKGKTLSFIDELKPLTRTKDKALAFSLLGTLYALLGDVSNMDFNYLTALKFSANDLRIRFNYATDLCYTNRPVEAYNQAHEMLTFKIRDIVMLHSIYILLDNLIKINECEKVMNMIEQLPPKQRDNYSIWIKDKKALLKAYSDLDINLSMLSQLIDGVQTDLVPHHPKSVYIEHFYNEDDKTIVYSFIDEKSDTDTAFELDEQLADYIINFETKNNIHFNNFVMMYEAR